MRKKPSEENNTCAAVVGGHFGSQFGYNRNIVNSLKTKLNQCNQKKKRF